MSKEYSRSLALSDLLSEDEKTVCQALVGIAFCEPDSQWAQNKFLDFLGSNNINIKKVSAVCLGHVARIHQKIDKNKVIPELEKYLSNPDMQGTIFDALDDIHMFSN